MAYVSNFEVAYKSATPVGFSTTPKGRKISKGYSLTISNLDQKPLNFILRFKIPKRNDNLSYYSFTRNNHQVIFDISGNKQTSRLIIEPFFINSVNVRFYRTVLLEIPPGKTASLQIIPKIDLAAQNQLNPKFDIRGYTEIFQAGNFTYLPTTSPPPKKILLSPETRGTMIDIIQKNNLISYQERDEFVYGLPLCEGKACITLSDFALIPFDYSPIPELVVQLESVLPILKKSGKELTLPYQSGAITLSRKSTRSNFKINHTSSTKLEKFFKKIKSAKEKKKYLKGLSNSIERQINNLF